MTHLQQLRQGIDRVDRQILKLLNERAHLAIEVGKYKTKESSIPVYMRHEREAQILTAITQHGTRTNIPIHAHDLQNIYRTIISACRSLESPMKIAYLGPAGTYSEIAAKRYFCQSENVIFLPQNTIGSIFQEVENERAFYGVVPIENSYEGYVSSSTDELIGMKKATICAEVKMPIEHSLLSGEKEITRIEKLYAHPQSYAQCSAWIEPYQWQVETVQSNGLAAKLAKQHPKSAAIASPQAAKEYGLNELERKIQNQANNTTRFLIIGTHPVEPSGDDKTTLVFALKNEAGALQKALSILAKKNIDMSQILSRPDRFSEWEYLFLIDVKGHQKIPQIKEGIEQLKAYVPMLKVLGSYPITPNI